MVFNMVTIMELFDLVLIILLVIIFVYWYLDRKFSYWARKNAPYEPAPSWIFGSLKEVFFRRQTSVFIYDKLYRKFEGKPYCGFYEFLHPTLLIRDPQLIKEVMVEKFSSFRDQRVSVGVNFQVNEILELNPLLGRGDRWKENRATIVSGVTPVKIRVLEEYFKPIFKNIKSFLETNPNDIDAFELARRYTGEMAAMYGWGINGDKFFEDKDLKELFKKNQFTESQTATIQHLFPFLGNWLRLSFHTKEFVEFMKQITGQAVHNLEESKVSQSTFLQNLLNIREKHRQNGKDLSLKEITAHMNSFYMDAYETLGIILGVFIQCLMMYPNVQHKLRKEINSVTGEITIDSVKLCYMEMVLSEIRRMYSIVPYFGRICTEKCKIGDLEVDAGTYISIPSYSIHHDEKYYPNPDVFNPENFSEENISKRPKFTHFLFGYGPRMCPGMKYALASLKLFIAHLLKEYEILPPLDHPANTMEFNPQCSFFILPKGELYVKFRKL